MCKLFLYSALLLILAAGIVAPAQAQTGLASSAWPNSRHDASLTARAQITGPSIAKLKWTANIGCGPLGAPTIAGDGTIYVPGNANDILYAVASDGHLLWSFTGKKLPDELFVAPAVVGRDGVIYFGSTQKIFYAVNADGSLRWSVKLDGEVRVSANIGSDGTIYVAARDCRLYAITPAGEIKWRVNLERLPGNAPAISSDGTIYVVAGEFLKGFASDGSRRLEVDCADMGVLYGLLVDGFELIYVTGESPRVRAISNTAAIKWEYDFPASFGAPKLSALGKDGSLYFASDQCGVLFVLNHNGTKRWSYSQSTKKFLTELAIDDANQVYIVEENNGLMSTSATGQLRWKMPEVHCQFSPGFGADGTLYIASDKKLYAIGGRQSKLAVEVNSLEWGEICVGSSATRTLKISNTGNADLQVSNLVVSNLAFQVESRNFVLKPGSQQTVQVKFTPVDFIYYPESLTIFSDAGNVAVALKGTGIGASIAAVTDTLQFGEVVIGKSTTKLAQVLNAGACDVRIDSVKVTGAFSVDAANLPKVLVKGDTAQFAVRFSPAILGSQQAALLIYNNGRQRNPLVISLLGAGASTPPEIEVASLTLDFGKICSERQLYTVVTNAGDEALKVDSLVFVNSAFTTNHAKSFTVAAGKSDTIRVRFNPVAGAESNGTLLIFSNDADEKSVSIKLHGGGGVPDIAGSSEIDFGVVDVQICAGLLNSAAQTLVIHNDGDCDLKIDSLMTTRIFSLASPLPPQILSAGASMSVPLKFTPTAPGEQTGTLRIVSNDPDEHVVAVKLRGRGVAAPDIAVKSDTVDFGAVPVGDQQTATLNIRNLGTMNLAVANLEISSARFTTTTRQFALACKQDSAVAIAFAPDSVGLFTATLSVVSNDPDEATVKIFLRGRGAKSLQALIATDASEYRFPAICVGSRDSLRAVITNKGNSVLRVDSVRVRTNRQIFLTAAFGFVLEPQQSKMLKVFFEPARPAEYTATVQIFSNAGNGRVFEVALHGLGSAPAISGQKQMTFALTKVDSARRDSYLVSNLGDCPLALTSVKIEGLHANDFKVIDAGLNVISPHGSSRVTLEFKPSSSNVRQAKLVILSSDPVQPRFEIALNGSGNGIPGQLAGPNSIDFGQACFDENVTRECTFTNTGQAEFKIIRIAAARSELFKIVGAVQLPKLLRPQEAVAIFLSFATRNSGVFKDTLLVQTDLSASATFRVALQGAGREDMARLDISRQALAFNGHLDETQTALVTITNSGCGRIEVSQVELARKLRVFGIHPEIPLPVKLEKSQSLNVEVSFKGDDFRAFVDSLYIYCVDWQQNRERLSVSLSGKVTDGAPCLQVAFSKLDFGEVAVGQAKRLDLEVTNCSADSRIVVRAIEPASGHFRVLPDTLTIFPNNPQFFAVNFAPRRNGEIADTLKLVYHVLSDPGQAQTQKIVLRGAATGNRAYAMPNAFTPNGDGKNDQAKIHFSGYDPASLMLRVYDLRGIEVRLLHPERRGELEIGWDGRNDRGDLQMPGAYLWLLEDNGKKIGSGQVVLIR